MGLFGSGKLRVARAFAALRAMQEFTQLHYHLPGNGRWLATMTERSFSGTSRQAGRIKFEIVGHRLPLWLFRQMGDMR